MRSYACGHCHNGVVQGRAKAVTQARVQQGTARRSPQHLRSRPGRPAVERKCCTHALHAVLMHTDPCQRTAHAPIDPRAPPPAQSAAAQEVTLSPLTCKNASSHELIAATVSASSARALRQGRASGGTTPTTRPGICQTSISYQPATHHTTTACCTCMLRAPPAAVCPSPSTIRRHPPSSPAHLMAEPSTRRPRSGTHACAAPPATAQRGLQKRVA